MNAADMPTAGSDTLGRMFVNACIRGDELGAVNMFKVYYECAMVGDAVELTDEWFMRGVMAAAVTNDPSMVACLKKAAAGQGAGFENATVNAVSAVRYLIDNCLVSVTAPGADTALVPPPS